MRELVLYAADPRSVPGIGASPPSWMCAALLVHKGIPHRIVPLSFERGDHRSDEMLAKNPRGTIPVLTDGDAIVHETLAVMTYIEHLAPGLLSLDHGDRASHGVAVTRFFEAEHLKTAGMAALAYVMRTHEGGRDADVVAGHVAALGVELTRWDGYAADGYVAGRSLTLADFVVHAYVATFRHLGLSIAPWPRLVAHHDRLACLAAFASTRPETFSQPAETAPLAVEHRNRREP